MKIKLVPSTSWCDNLKRYTIKEDWDKIRKSAYANYGHRCGICGVKGKLNCHEIWEYDAKKHIQKLKGSIALCDMCHHAKHIGLSGILSLEGKLNYEKAIKHFMKVNNCSRETFDEHRKRAFEEWRERSKHQWDIDLGECRDVIKDVSKKFVSLKLAFIRLRFALPKLPFGCLRMSANRFQ